MVILITTYILFIFMLSFIYYNVSYILCFLFCIWSFQYLKSLGEVILKMFLLTSLVSCFVAVWWFLLNLIFPNPDSINGNYIPSERICIFFCWDQGYYSLKQLYLLSRVLGLTGLSQVPLCHLVLAVVDWYLPSEQY